MENSNKSKFKIKPTGVNIILLAILLITNITAIALSLQRMGDLKQDNIGLMAELEDLRADTRSILDYNKQLIANTQDLTNYNAFLSFKDDILARLNEIQLNSNQVPLGTYQPPITIEKPVYIETPVLVNDPAIPASVPTPPPTSEATQAPVTITGNATPTPVATADQKVVVTVKAPSVDDMYAYEFKMNFDESQLDFEGGLKSAIKPITMIFSKPFDGYRLVGATMISDVDGYTGSSVDICEMTFTLKKELSLNELNLSISDIGIVSSDETYTEGITGWSLEVKMSD